MEPKIIGIVKDIGNFLIGEVVEETDTTLVLKDLALLGITASGPQINIEFIPADLLSMQPPVGLKNLVKDPTMAFEAKFKKENLLFYNLELKNEVISNYKSFTGKSANAVQPQATTPVTPDNNVVKLFD
jgi:hypothetical protein